MRRAIRLAVPVLAIFFVAACTTRPVIDYNENSLNVPSSANLTMQQVEEAIFKAATVRHWEIRRIRQGELEAKYDVKSHGRYVAFVRIIHDTRSYSIIYKDSSNLKFKEGRIHRNYNNWIRRLKLEIQKQTQRTIEANLRNNRTTPVATSAPPPPIARSSPRLENRKYQTGSGFIVSTAGHILTNNRLVRNCTSIRALSVSNVEFTGISVRRGRASVRPETKVQANDGSISMFDAGELKLLTQDAGNDLALLKSEWTSLATATFRAGRGLRLGDDVIIAGFPHSESITPDLSVARGLVSSMDRVRTNRGSFQITAPMQPGKIGGPVFDQFGWVVGAVTGRSDSLKVAWLRATPPRNVNIATSEEAIRAFLDVNNVPYVTDYWRAKLRMTEIAAKARDFTVVVECWK